VNKNPIAEEIRIRLTNVVISNLKISGQKRKQLPVSRDDLESRKNLC
jgi:hypothetical protein